MHFGLLISQFPHVHESRPYYDAMPVVEPAGRVTFKMACEALLRRVRARFV